MQPKLKWVLDQVPQGQLIDTPTLKSHGVTRQLVHKYIQSGWLTPVIRGLYRRAPGAENAAENTLEWRTVVHSLQAVMGYDCVIGGRTALEEQGLRHYVPLGGEAQVHLYGDDHPGWLKRLSGPTDYVLHNAALFDGTIAETADVQSASGPLRCSSPERAILEMLDELPKGESFHMADMAFEGLASARPKRLAHLLKHCTSIKVKRLFFVFADRHNHAWRKHLNADEYDLGAGPRALVKGGKIHPRYKISVPEDYLPKNEGADDGP
ncbi:type IV toxin-antitoxin system AbiEi family antitoxin domain-containing protein [Hyphococcus luteus]|uniref:type IV toxin-antitoxin system AbiEi family antitoxin domain-containing protein n=1 Tax=Hyphococcus luteus TaxID=2058213 RepID=UPI001A9C426D|nr:type IV toxin-antitoxin system AbiEi family antitoxin domain-containing protein [Marinicaulis flavus]